MSWPLAIFLIMLVLSGAATVQKWIEKKPQIEQARATRYVYCCQHAKASLHDATPSKAPQGEQPA